MSKVLSSVRAKHLLQFPTQTSRVNSIYLRSNSIATSRFLSSVHTNKRLSSDTLQSEKRHYSSAPPKSSKFDLTGKVMVVTGGGRGLGLTMAEALVEAGAIVHCIDRLEEPDEHFREVQEQVEKSRPGSLHYQRMDVRNNQELNDTITSIADRHSRIDGLIAAAGVQQITDAVDYTAEDVTRLMDVNFTGVFMTAAAVAREMLNRGNGGSIVLVGSMSGLIANKGLISPAYNCSKAAVLQLARSLAMEWSRKGIRVNSLSPGHIITPMVEKNFEEVPGLKETWEKENMMGRLAQPEEFTGAAIFLLSDASSFMTGSSLLIDGGHTAW